MFCKICVQLIVISFSKKVIDGIKQTDMLMTNFRVYVCNKPYYSVYIQQLFNDI